MSTSAVIPPDDRCRLCAGSVVKAFETNVLGRYEVAYFRCVECQSLQSEPPYWLDEAYQSAIAAADTGAVSRNIICHAAIVAIARILRLKGRFLDYGGGAGMLCRMLRDSGFDAYLFDRYAEPVYARAFVLDPKDVEPETLSLISAIEVLEHCVSPAQDIGELFDARAQVLFATTIPYNGEGKDWWYLTPRTGQHIFFYSSRGLTELAGRYGYQHSGFGEFHVFTRTPVTRWQHALLRWSLSSLGLRAWRVWIAAIQRGHHVEADYDVLCKQLPGVGREDVDRSASNTPGQS